MCLLRALTIQGVTEDEVEGDGGRKKGKKKRSTKKGSQIEMGEEETEEPPTVDTTVDQPQPAGEETKEEGE